MRQANQDPVVQSAIVSIQLTGEEIQALGARISVDPHNVELWDMLWARLTACANDADAARRWLRAGND